VSEENEYYLHRKKKRVEIKAQDKRVKDKMMSFADFTVLCNIC